MVNPAELLDAILKQLEFVYGSPWIAPFVLLPMILLGAILIHIEALYRTRPYLRAARKRIERLREVLGADSSAIAERSAFSERFAEVIEIMETGGRRVTRLIQAWREFHESIIDENASPIKNTSRPSSYFQKAMPRQTKLLFWSNVFVGLGLILTFLGLVVALHTASKGMSGNTEGTKQALTTLLTVAGAKFFTSIAGIVASLWLRFAEYGLTRNVQGATDEICALIERGMLYIPPQRIAAEQLEVLRAQRDELKSFNTDLAFQIGENIGVHLQQASSQVSASLTSINANISAMSEGLGKGAAQAVAEASGGELRALGQTLAALGDRLDALGATVGNSGDDAARQIRLAGSEFAQAAADIRAAFGTLTQHVEGLGTKLVEQGEAASKAQADALTKAVADFDDTNKRSTNIVQEAIKSLRSAGEEAALEMQKKLGAALTEGVAESQRTFRTALEESGEGLRTSANTLASSIDGAAGKIERAGSSFEESSTAAQETAGTMKLVAAEARSAGTSLAEASKALALAAQPVSKATQSINEASERVVRAIEAAATNDADTMTKLTALADGIRDTQHSAAAAWQDYKARFEGVDKALEVTTTKLGETLGDTFQEFRKFAQETDRELGAAVSKLSQTLTAIEDYAEALSDHVEAGARRPALEPAQ